jgi:hypothetical protein
MFLISVFLSLLFFAHARYTPRSLIIHARSLTMELNIVNIAIVNIAIAVVAVGIGIPCAYHALLHIWAFHRPNGKTAKALRPTTIVLQTTVAPGALKPTAWQRRTHQTEQLIAKRLGILVRQRQRKAAVDERIARHLETLVTEQRTRPPRNFRGTADVNFNFRDPGY